LGFTGHDFDPIVRSLFPSIVKTAELPLYNPIISETPLVFPAAGTYYYYLTDPDRCKYLTFLEYRVLVVFCLLVISRMLQIHHHLL